METLPHSHPIPEELRNRLINRITRDHPDLLREIAESVVDSTISSLKEWYDFQPRDVKFSG